MKLFNKISNLLESKASEIKDYVKYLLSEYPKGDLKLEDIGALTGETNFGEFVWSSVSRKVLNDTEKKLTKEVVTLGQKLIKDFNLRKDLIQPKRIGNSEQINDTLQHGDTLSIDALFDIGFDLPLIKRDMDSKLKTKFKSDLGKVKKELKQLGIKYHNEFFDNKKTKEETLYKEVLDKYLEAIK